ncbi:hypothetical protein H2508_01275 [Parahaliea sp. F7430]|uniref:Uncharacterized protein n=1 Tax=Sediminihaliea albiluteola TaxID=2758564 RepID=A0A7W2YI75_9GAMM|nr:hypothetical protein [Sediminihaliea albiluteola]MBA6411742.1 hypothetical protein [Sediminihaliea albiluteola]
MKKSVVISITGGLVMLFLLCVLFSGTANNTGLFDALNPVGAVQGLAFTLSFAAGMPSSIALVMAIAVFVLLPGAVFLVTLRALRRYER